MTISPDECEREASGVVTLNILADENIPAVEHYLGALGNVRRVAGRSIARDQVKDVDILLVRSVTKVNSALLEGSRVQFVGSATSGFDHIDRAFLAQRGVAFSHAPGSNANSVVEYVLAAIAAVADTLEQLLAGGTVGIVGYGIIGKALAARLSALGIGYRICDPWLDQQTIPHAADLKALLDCDVVTLHCELSTRLPWPSHHLLGAAQLRQLRPDALLINASRGAVVDNTALLAHLESGRGPSTVVDVWEGEPDICEHLLQAVTLGTAHIAGYSLDGKLLATRMLCDAVTAALQLRPLPMESPLPERVTDPLPAGMSVADLIRFLLRSRYEIRLDDTLLRQAILENQQPVAGQRFDGLRKHYRERRELEGTLVLGPLANGQLPVVQALGCLTGALGTDQ